VQPDPHLVAKYEAGAFEDDARAAESFAKIEGEIDALEQMVR
jgi:hypothetical protein